MKTNLIGIAAIFTLSACATTELTTGGEKVRVLEPSEVSTCREMGKTTNSVPAKFIVDRPIETVTRELEDMARNSAARLGGDTVVPLTLIEEGQQTFIVYKCVDPDG